MEQANLYENGGTKTVLDQYFTDLRGVTIPDGKEMIELLKRATTGDVEARNEIVIRNQRLVVSVAKKYANHGLSLEDLIQEGNFGLFKAIERFDISVETKFSTYAVFWIKQTIHRAIYNKVSGIRIPVYMQENLYKIKKAQLNYKAKCNCEPSVEELAKLCDLKKFQVENTLKNEPQIYSLDYEVSPSHGNTEVAHTIGENIEDEDANVEQNVIKKVMADELDQQMKRLLSDREQNVIKMRFGIGQKKYTLQEIGDLYGVTREGIRQIENRAMQKLYRSHAIRELAYV